MISRGYDAKQQAMVTTKKQIEMLSTTSPEELARVEVLSGEAIEKALQQGRAERREAEASETPGPTDSRILFRA